MLLASFCFKMNVCWLKLFACLCYQIKSLLSFVQNFRLYICLFLLSLLNNVTWQGWYLELVACYPFLPWTIFKLSVSVLKKQGMHSVSTFFSGRFSWLNMIAFLWTFTLCELSLCRKTILCILPPFLPFSSCCFLHIFRWYLVVIEFNNLACHD